MNPEQQRNNNEHGIGDGKPFTDFDLPDVNRNGYIRKRFQDHKRNGKLVKIRPSLTKNDGDANDWEPDQVVHTIDHGQDAARFHEGYVLKDKSYGTVNGVVDYPFVVLFWMLVIFMAFTISTFISDHGRLPLHRKRSDRKLVRTESQMIKQKKKTDEWNELDDGYSDFLAEEFEGETDIDIPSKRTSSNYYGGGDLYRSDSARQRKTSTDLNPQRQAQSDRHLSDAQFRRRSVVHRDEESPSRLSNPCAFDSVEKTPLANNKQPIYVDSFSQLTMADISIRGCRSEETTSLSVSDGNAILSQDGLESSIMQDHANSGETEGANGILHKRPDLTFGLERSIMQDHANSGETEGANGLLHKRKDLSASSDAYSSLHSPIPFSELKLNRLIGGGGFGQVWSASWNYTPVAVKLLTACSQTENVQKAILQEFVAEINMLSGMKHPNICLYLGACLEPSNRAIVTGTFT
jgi:hypothetical protein